MLAAGGSCSTEQLLQLAWLGNGSAKSGSASGPLRRRLASCSQSISQLQPPRYVIFPLERACSWKCLGRRLRPTPRCEHRIQALHGGSVTRGWRRLQHFISAMCHTSFRVAHPVRELLNVALVKRAVTLWQGGGSGGNDGHGRRRTGGEGEGGGGEAGWQQATWGCMLAKVEDAERSGKAVVQGVPPHLVDPSITFKCTNFDIKDEHGEVVSQNFGSLGDINIGDNISKEDLQEVLDTLEASGAYDRVKVLAHPDYLSGELEFHVRVTLTKFMPKNGCRIRNAGSYARNSRDHFGHQNGCIIPASVTTSISQWLRRQPYVTVETLRRCQQEIEDWYYQHGFIAARVLHYHGLDTATLHFDVLEGVISKLEVLFEDDLGKQKPGGTLQDVVRREVRPGVRGDKWHPGFVQSADWHLTSFVKDTPQLTEGAIYNREVAAQTMGHLLSKSRALRSARIALQNEDSQNEELLTVQLILKEAEPMDTGSEFDWKWGNFEEQTMLSLVPGGRVYYEHHNLDGKWQSVTASVSSENLMFPEDDIGFKLEWRKPYFDGVDHPSNRTLSFSAFNQRKLSPVFAASIGEEQPVSIFVDRQGGKAMITNDITRQSRLTYGGVLEEVAVRDETGAIVPYTERTTVRGDISRGPPTTLSGNGRDFICFLQFNLLRDNTSFVNGALVGARDCLQVEQGLGLGSRFAFFNRYRIMATRFVQLTDQDMVPTKRRPLVLVLHGRHSGSIGDLPGYDAFPLGGPYSVRGYDVGELGAFRYTIELAGELRVPMGETHVYVFGEYGSGLGSGAAVRGDPSAFFSRVGKGGSFGFGMEVTPQVRAEIVRDLNQGDNRFWLRHGERF